MKFSSEETVFTTRTFFKNSSPNGPLCKEYEVVPKNGIHYKIALIFLFILCVIHHAIFVDYEDLSNKYFIICFFSICSILIIVNLSFTIEKESLLLVVPLTLQMTTTYIFGSESTFSIPWQALGDFMIIEVIMRHQIHYFLSVDIDKRSENNEKVEHVILFRRSKPRLKVIEIVYRDLQLILDKGR